VTNKKSRSGLESLRPFADGHPAVLGGEDRTAAVGLYSSEISSARKKVFMLGTDLQAYPKVERLTDDANLATAP
jgi:hypothetical protein